jgi:hypothetical protein
VPTWEGVSRAANRRRVLTGDGRVPEADRRAARRDAIAFHGSMPSPTVALGGTLLTRRQALAGGTHTAIVYATGLS